MSNFVLKMKRPSKSLEVFDVGKLSKSLPDSKKRICGTVEIHLLITNEDYRLIDQK
jgi:peroxiredoxin